MYTLKKNAKRRRIQSSTSKICQVCGKEKVRRSRIVPHRWKIFSLETEFNFQDVHVFFLSFFSFSRPWSIIRRSKTIGTPVNVIATLFVDVLNNNYLNITRLGIGRRVGKRLFAYNRNSGSAATTHRSRKSSARVSAQHIRKEIRIDTSVSVFQQTAHASDIFEIFSASRDRDYVRFSNYQLSRGFRGLSIFAIGRCLNVLHDILYDAVNSKAETVWSVGMNTILIFGLLWLLFNN